MPDENHNDDNNNNNSNNNSNDSNNSNSWNSTSFATFFETWLVRQEHYLDELMFAETNYNEQTQEQELRALISRVFSHYQQYYEAKTLALRNNVFHVFSPSWFSSLEQSLLWIGGFKPALAFRLVGYSVSDLTEEQSERMERLRSETRTAEKELEEEMASVQESVAAPPMLEMARRAGRLVDGDRRIGVDTVLETLRNSMELLVESADLLRATTTRKVIEILTPAQGIRLLIAAAQLQLRVRMWGFQRDAMERARSP